MTSPEKRAFSRQLFEHDDKINIKVRKTLQAANNVHSSTLNTIEESRQVIKQHDDAQRTYSESIAKHME